MPPMRGGAPAGEQAGLGQAEGPGAHGRQTPGPSRHGSERLDELRIDRPPDQVVTAGDHHGVAKSIAEIRSVTAKLVPIEVVTSRPFTDAILSR